MLHLPTILIMSLVLCCVVTSLLVLTRATLGAAAAGAITWVTGDMLFQFSRMATMAERVPDMLPWHSAVLMMGAPVAIVPAGAMLAATWCHRCALLRVAGNGISWQRCGAEIALIVGAFVAFALQVEGMEMRTRVVSAALVIELGFLCLAVWPLTRRFWGARLIFLLAVLTALGSVLRAAGLAPPHMAGPEQDGLSFLFLINVGVTLTVTMSFMVLLQERVRVQILKVSQTDPLTGLYNRRGLLDALERDLDRLRANDVPMAVALFDLDHFKKINDTHGHKTGDAVLAGFADCLRSQCRRGDLLGRWGGEEFVVAMPGTDTASAVNVANRIRNSLIRRGWPVADMNVTVSAGVVQTMTTDEATGEQLIDRADRLLYLAKQRRDTVCSNDECMEPAQAA